MNEIIDNIYEKTVELANLKTQRKLWLNENNDTESISSYSELMCSLFDDFSFDDFVDNIAFEINLSNSAIYELKHLRDLLNDYNEKESDEEIINDSEWGKVVKQANIVLQKWVKQ